ncbi:MAG: ABC transporter ATP-binding protein, partial [Ferruginibacter sp.]
SRVRMYTGPALMYFINLAAVIVLSIWFMWTTDALLTLVALSPMPFLVLTIYWLNARINKKSELVQQSLSSMTSLAQESYSGIRVIKSYAREKDVSDVFQAQTDQYKNESLDLAKTEAFYFPSMALLIGLSTLLIILVGGWQVTNHMPGASVGKITSFILYVQLLTFPVSAIGWTVSMVQRAAVSQKRILEFLEYKPVLVNKPVATDIPLYQTITFRSVDFTYKNTGIQALHDINWKISTGQRIAVVGRTGSGKTTLLQMLLRLIDPDAGNITIDNKPLHNIALDAWRSQIGYVPQEPLLFSETIRDNIQMGNPTADEQTLTWAATMAGVHQEIDAFPGKYDTIVGERGITLSGGQKQRISLARALVRKPAMLILDDVFSALDPIKEEAVCHAFNKSLQDTTILYSTGRHITSLQTDYIVCLANGEIAELGTHDELMKKQGVYAAIMLENNRNSTL